MSALIITGAEGTGSAGGSAAPTYTEVKAAIGAANSALDLNAQKIVNVGTPTDPTDVPTKGYVDTAVVAGASAPVRIEGTSPPGGSVGFAAELYLGPSGAGYSYVSGGAGYLPGCVFASTLKHISFRTVAAAIDLTVRLRTSAGTQIYSKLFIAGSTLIDEAVNIAIAHDVLVQLSVEPASGGPSIDVWSFGWKREVA